MMRINKYLASCELGSRRKVEELILDGKVKVNGVICKDLSTVVNPSEDEVAVGHHKVKPTAQKIFIMLNKPRGYVVTKSDEFKRKTVYDLLPDFAKNLHPVGRLDYDSEGLLILTNDGDITNKITHPAYKLEKIYKVIIKGKISMEDVVKLRKGVMIDGKMTQTAKVFLKTKHTPSNKDKASNASTDAAVHSELRIGIKEGKNRQLRKMLEAVGYDVHSLKRLSIGEIKLDKLPTGMWRFLRDSEILYLLRIKR